MKQFTCSENETRKNVFQTVRKEQYLTDSELKRIFGRSKLVLQAISEARQRIVNNLPYPSAHRIFFNKIKKNAENCAGCLPYSGYSMGEYKYITNRLYGVLEPGDKYTPNVVARCDNTQEYRGRKFRATHGHVEVELPISILSKAEVLEGMITIRGKQVQNRIWKCQWVVWDYERNKRGFITSTVVGYHLVNGYMAKCNDTLSGVNWRQIWYHCESLREVRAFLHRAITCEKEAVKRIKKDKKRVAKEEKEIKRWQREQEKINKQERKAVMVHRKKYTQKEVNRAAWIIFGKMAQCQKSCLYHLWYDYGHKLDINEDDAFERDVKKAWENICKEHDVIKEQSKHNSRAKQAKYWSEQPVNILQHPLVKNFGNTTEMDEYHWTMSLPSDVIHAYSLRDKKIFAILMRMYRRQMAAKFDAVVKSEELIDGLHHMYVYRDSIAAGNCVPGTDGFIADHGLQKTDARSGEFLLNISRDSYQHSNVIRVIEHYISQAHSDFYQQNARIVNKVLRTI